MQTVKGGEKSVLQFLKNIQPWKIAVLLALFFAIAIFLLCSGAIFCLPSLIESQIRTTQVLEGNTVLMNRWTHPQYQIQSHMFTYSVKNPDDIIASNAVPRVRRTGPYVFDHHQERKVHSINDTNGTLLYETVQTYHFNDTASCVECNLYNRIWIPNLVFQKFIETTLIPSMKAPAIAALITQTPFLEVEVGELLYDGYADPFLHEVCNIPFVNFVCEKILEFPERIGLFFQKNGSSSGLFLIKNGHDDNGESLGQIILWKNADKLPTGWWDNELSLSINGTDGSLIAPYISKDDVLQVFVPDMCRSINLVFQKEVTVEGVLAYRFVVPLEEWNWTREENRGFCHSTSPKRFFKEQVDSCLPTGLLDLSRCTKGEPPIVVSSANFLYAPEFVRKSVEGLERDSNQELDQIELDVEPRIGAILQARRRFMINIAMWKGKNLTLLPQDISRARDSIIPVLEIDEQIKIDDESLRIIKSRLIDMEKYARISLDFGLVLSIVAILILSLYTIFKFRRETNQDRISKIASTGGMNGTKFNTPPMNGTAYSGTYQSQF